MAIGERIRHYYRLVMDTPDAPAKIARGVATGVALDFLPIPFISIPIAFVLARLIRGHGAVAALVAALFKWAVPFFYVFNVAVGSLVLNIVNLGQMELTANISQWTQGGWMDYLVLLGYPFLTGAVINTVIAWVLVYFTCHRILLVRQKRKGVMQ